MPVPRGCYIDDVEFELSQILEVPLALAEACWLWLARFCDRLLRSRNFFRHQIANRLDFYLFDCEQILQQAGTAPADADNSQAYLLSCFERDADHGGVRVLRCIGIEVRTHNVHRSQESRTANRGALYKTSSRDFTRFLIPCHCVASYQSRSGQTDISSTPNFAQLHACSLRTAN